MLDKNPHPTDAQIRESMNGTLCRCMSYYRVQTAIKRAAKTLADARPLPKGGGGMSVSDRIPSTDRRSPGDQSPGLPQKRGTARGELRRIRRSRTSRGRRADTAAAQGPGPYPNPDFRQIDSWIVIHQDNTATFYVGKTDPGQGTGTGFRQLMSDELDIAFDRTTCIMGSTDITVDQVGSGGSTAMERDSWPMRRVAAEARRVLLEMASARLGVPVDQLAVSNAVITVKADPSKRVTYGELIGGKKFNVTLNGEQHQRGHRSSQDEDGAGAQVHRPVAAARRHSRQSGRLSEMGGRRQAARHGARAQRQASVRLREADGHRRIVGEEPAGLHQGGEQRQLRRRGVRARRAGHPRRPPAQDDLGEAVDRSVPAIRRSVQLHAHGDTRLAGQGPL